MCPFNLWWRKGSPEREIGDLSPPPHHPFHFEVTTIASLPCSIPRVSWSPMNNSHARASKRKRSVRRGFVFCYLFPRNCYFRLSVRLAVWGSCLVLFWTPLSKWDHITCGILWSYEDLNICWWTSFATFLAVSQSGFVIRLFILFYTEWK